MNKRNYIIILIFVLLSTAIIVFFVLPYFSETIIRSRELVLEKGQVTSFKTQIKELEDFKGKYDNYLPNLQKIEKMFVNPQDPISFIEFIENTAADSNITLQVSSQFSSREDFKSIILQLSAKGRFSDLSMFLKKIEHGSYLINIESINLSAIKGGGGASEQIIRNFSEEIQADLLVEVLSQ